jgi:hypothetical protein
MNARLLLQILCLVCVLDVLVYPQSAARDRELLKAAVLGDLKTLALEIPKLDAPLARATASAEIADAAWTLDRKWARSLLKDAYELTYPTEEELRKLGPQQPGDAPRELTPIGAARDQVRRRILSVARREKGFADQLITAGADHVTRDDRQMAYADLAVTALEEGDPPGAVHAIQESMAIDPTRLLVMQLINDLALKDRAAADKLTLDFISNLRTSEINSKEGRARADVVLRFIVFPNSFFPDPNKRIPDPGAEVMRAYVRYVIESLDRREQTQPGSLRLERSTLLSAWLPLTQYAPELKERFMQLEALSRAPGKDASLPAKSYDQLDEELREKRKREALNTDEPDDQAIDSVIFAEDFETARKLLGKLPDGKRKDRLTLKINFKQAVSLARKGDLLAAQGLAERLTTTAAILQVYPLIVEGYARRKDQVNAAALVQQALRQIKKLNEDSEGTLIPLGKLARALLPVDTLLAAEIVDDIVARANAGSMDTSQGYTWIESALFKELAAKDEVRARSAAESFKDRLRRIVASAAIYQWKAKELSSP